MKQFPRLKAGKPPAPSKYRNIAVNERGQPWKKGDGPRFASKAEAKRYGELKLLERGGVISHLERQPRFALVAGPINTMVGFYVADFRYREKGQDVAEEVKGFETREWKLKAKLFRTSWPRIDLRIIRA